MSEELVRNLFDRWERVWHERQYDLIPSCVGSHYVRHDEKGDRTVTREAYAAELAAVHADRPGTRIVVYDHSFTNDRAWFRFSFVWPDPQDGRAAQSSGDAKLQDRGRQACGDLDYATAARDRVDGWGCTRTLDEQASLK
jgi:hypothetical protein